jgi:hypothetical protein
MMGQLLVAELRRIWARRLVRLTITLSAVGIVLGGVAAFARSGSLSEAAYQQRVADANERVHAQEAQIGDCLRAHGIEPNDEIPDDVAKQCFPRDETAGANDPRFHRARLKGILQGVTGALAVVGWALGASLVGAEFASRSMTTLLTWEPRRGRVFLTKSVAALTAMAVLSLAALVLVCLVMWPSLAFHGAPLRASDPTWRSLAATIGRGVALATIATGLGFGIATIGRSTAAALGVGFAYVIVFENVVGSSLEEWRPWLLLGNVIVFVSGRNDGGDVPGRSVTAAGLFLAAVALAILVLAASSFHRRDLA